MNPQGGTTLTGNFHCRAWACPARVGEVAMRCVCGEVFALARQDRESTHVRLPMYTQVKDLAGAMRDSRATPVPVEAIIPRGA
jgi:hypothetical protein